MQEASSEKQSWNNARWERGHPDLSWRGPGVRENQMPSSVTTATGEGYSRRLCSALLWQGVASLAQLTHACPHVVSNLKVLPDTWHARKRSLKQIIATKIAVTTIY